MNSDHSDDASCVRPSILNYDMRSATDKEFNVSIRLAAVSSIKTLLTRRYIALEKWSAVLIDITDKALRKTDEEAKLLLLYLF
ncbi:unnamed protein product [Acanthocheilonema viteae]|uniref:Uncharacterized protein n=1 Tax=Acanthocheilonema viteae TaxID=6277 RepID=A0A498SA61_ACAVI|nr:unnamed protein product [Acanthocheilonema viteae]